MPVPDDLCEKCGNLRSTTDASGKTTYLRCQCDYQRELLERRRATIDKSYWGLTMGDWTPKMFAEPNQGAFKNYIRVQRLAALHRLWEYCFRPERNGDAVRYALQQSVDCGRNLFIRGPKGSGRGLLSACVKTAAAIKGISTTPLSCDISVFKNEIQESESFSKSGDDAKINIWQKYQTPSLLVLENATADKQRDMRGVNVPKTFKYSGSIDSLLAKRVPQAGSLLMTSFDFIGEIADTLGSVLYEVLLSEKTLPLVLLDVKEAEAILWTLGARKRFMFEVVNSFKATGKAERKLQQERLQEKISLETLREGIYFEDVFQNIPDAREVVGTEASSIHDQFEVDGSKFEPKALEVWAKFLDDKGKKSLAYENNRQVVLISAIKSCKELSSRLSDKECQEIGRIASKATAKDLSSIQNLEERAKVWLSDMGADQAK